MSALEALLRMAIALGVLAIVYVLVDAYLEARCMASGGAFAPAGPFGLGWSCTLDLGRALRDAATAVRS